MTQSYSPNFIWKSNGSGGYKAERTNNSEDDAIIPVKFSDDFFDMLEEIKSPIVDALFDLAFTYDNNTPLKNPMRIEDVSISEEDSKFNVRIGNRNRPLKITNFIRHFFSNDFTNRDIFKFCQEYNRIKNTGKWASKYGSGMLSSSTPINSDLFKKRFDPKDVRSTFISLVTETYPHGHEEEVMKYMPEGLTKDEFGNYYTIIGESDTMFTSHLDTADRNQSTTSLYSVIKKDDEFIITDGSSLLGADDKAGVCVLLYMMSHNVPGVYYFFIGEERGGIGSRQVAAKYNTFPHLKGIKKCISFDRRNYHSVITEQMMTTCCSDEFATSLCVELNKRGMDMSLDPTGVYTDSVNFIDDIPECTNISVGYFDEHTGDERLNMTFLQKLCRAAILVDWSSLSVVRKVGFDDFITRKYGKFLDDVKSKEFYNEIRVSSEDGFAFIRLKFEDGDVESAHEDLLLMAKTLHKHKFDPLISFEDETIKIELR